MYFGIVMQQVCMCVHVNMCLEIDFYPITEINRAYNITTLT